MIQGLSGLTMAALLLSQLTSMAQTSVEVTSSPFPSVEKQARTYEFENDPHGNVHLRTSTLKFIEAKNFVQLEFEGRGLKRGEYHIVRTDNCKTLEKALHSSKKSFEEDDLYSFKTESGDISTEEKMNSKNLAGLDLENKSVALVKVEKNKKVFVACAK